MRAVATCARRRAVASAAEAEAFLDPLALSADESSSLYTLPNGLPAYFLSDARGNRRGQSSVLFDTNEDDFVPRTAPSCVRCHSEGTHPVVDALRPYLAADPNGRFGPEELELLALAYPPQRELDALARADTRRVLDAQARVGVPGAGPLSSGRTALDDLYGLFGLDLSPLRAAGELFVSARELEARRSELPGALRVLLSVESLGRSSFNGAYRNALCVLQDAARNRPRDCP